MTNYLLQREKINQRYYIILSIDGLRNQFASDTDSPDLKYRFHTLFNEIRSGRSMSVNSSHILPFSGADTQIPSGRQNILLILYNPNINAFYLIMPLYSLNNR